MTILIDDQLTKMLSEGWAIAGYSVCMMAAGALTHNILMQKEGHLESVSIVTNGSDELGRKIHKFAPKAPEPAKPKGFFDLFNEKMEKNQKKRNK